MYQDNKKAMYELTGSLIKKGHTRIAHVSTFIGDVYHNDGVEGITWAIRKYGVDSYQQISVPSDTEQEDRVARLIPAGCRAVDEILQLDPQPTAVIFNVDTQALGAVQELHQRGIKVPETYSITANGCDPYTNLLQPSLTKVTVDSLEAGARCAKTLLDLVQKKKVAERQKIPMQVYEGNSVKPQSA
jgi:LacI family transcriptional regulator